MASASYSFLDVAALDGVRERFASGDALAILSCDLDEVIWANGPGATLFGYGDIEAAVGAAAQLGMAAKRQIASTRGFPDIGKDRPVQVRMSTGMSSRMVGFLASAITLPDGEAAILLAAPAATGGARSETDIAERAIGGFAGAGHFVAFVNATGSVEAASAGFDALGLTPETLAGLVQKAAAAGGRIVKQMIEGRNGALPAGLARLTETRNLLVVVDEGATGKEQAAPPPVEAPVEPEQTAAEAQDNASAVAQEEQPTGEARPAAHESWYFSEGAAGEKAAVTESGDEPPEHVEVAVTETPDDAAAGAPEAEDADSSATQDDAGEATEEPLPETAGEPPATVADAEDRFAAPVRFVWRTDAEGKFSHISPEFANAVGVEAANIVGRSFEEVSETLGLDPKGEIAGLLARRDTWSGRSVSWPVAGTDLHIPVDLAALPVYDRARAFEGFRGFGVARTGDITVDPKALGLTLGRTAEEPQDEAAAAVDEAGETKADPFQGEVPALSIVPAPGSPLHRQGDPPGRAPPAAGQ